MNGNDINGLSYKELQALALRYRVPGNIKKKLLIKVLQAAKSGNEREVAKLLHDLKQTRKKRARKMKPGKLGITSTPLHSPDYTITDDFYSPQQQPPYQWDNIQVGAEEEIGAREEEGRIPHYEEFRRFLLRKIQRECRVFDSNNNQVQETTIMDLRTGAEQLDVNVLPIEKYGYLRPNVISVDEANTCVFPVSSPIEYQILEDPNVTEQGSVLLKKMLQAPVGANLGEIASPIIGDYRTWSTERYQTENLLNNSDTLTAESDNNGEENLPSIVNCYGLVDNDKNEYILQDPDFARNTEETTVQLSNILTAENTGQYRYGYDDNNPHHNYQNWPTSSCGTITTDLNGVPTVDSESAGTFRTMYYETSELNQANDLVNTETSNYHFHTNENISYANSNQNAFQSSTDDIQYYNHNMIPDIQCNSLDTYYLQNLPKVTTEANSYFTRMNSEAETNILHSVNDAIGRQTYYTEIQNGSNVPRDQIALDSDGTQRQNRSSTDYLKYRHGDEAIIIGQGSNFQNVAGSNGILEPFVPKIPCVSSSNTCLENILNIPTTRCVDYGKIEQTCCVYCYTTPIVTDSETESISSHSRSKGLFAEERHHSFSTYCMIYDDTSFGMRMANLKIDNESKEGNSHNDKNREIQCETPIFDNNNEIREHIDVNDESTINDMWIHDYNQLRTPVKDNSEAYEDDNEEISDPLGFSIDKHTNDISMRRP